MGKALFLIVDDDPHLPKVLERIAARYFLECGRPVETAMLASGEEVLDFVDRKLAAHPDAEWGLMTDHDMPGMNGIQLLEALHCKLGDKLLMRIVMTGLLPPERRAMIDAAGAFAEEKPSDTATIQQYLHIFLTSLT